MRMWGVSPQQMCNKHLLGEHVELHMIVGSLNKNRDLSGYYSTGLIQTDRIIARHTELVEEMTNRGMLHISPLPDFVDPQKGSINPESYGELLNRCPTCRARMSS